MDVRIDTSQVDKLAIDLGKAGRRATLDAIPVISKAAVNIKKGMQADVSRSPHFKAVARDIRYDQRALAVVVYAEVGRGLGHQGGLAWNAAFGDSTHPSVWDHTAALHRELPNIEKYLGEIGVKSLE